MQEQLPKQVTPYGLRMPPSLKARVETAAKANNRSMNMEIVAALEEKFPDPEQTLELMDFVAKWLSENHPYVDNSSLALADYLRLAASQYFKQRKEE